MIEGEEFDMAVFGIALLITGAALVVAEAHVSGGVLGVTGGVALMAGGMLAIAAAGAGAAVAVIVGVSLGLIAGGWTLSTAHKVRAVRRLRIRAGSEALFGQLGVVRSWDESSGNVFVEGALWRAQADAPLDAGDSIVVEGIDGLTLSVRRAEDWELVR